MTADSTIHVVFKTHLDLGFTDYAANIAETYFQRFIPQAMALAARTRDHADRRFRWTTGAWLIYEYLEQAAPPERRLMEVAIEAGDILWHALPFTTHTELIDESLFRFGLTYSQKLDRRFGRATIAAKMTDVPGHTRAIIPLLAEAGIRLLHIGVNPASSVPDVPPVFRWRDEPSDSDIVVIYDQTYGGVTRVPDLDDVLAVILTGDNVGPPTEATVTEIYAALAQANPGAQLTASSLDAFAHRLDDCWDRLPIVSDEIGDSWIHGVGTDPTKVRRYRELSRLRRDWLARPLTDDQRERIDRFSHHLLCVPEHTWGMDIKLHLADTSHYEAPDLATLRQTERCRRFEASWTEQRAYLDAALAALDGSVLADEANQRLAQTEPALLDLSSLTPSDDFSLRSERFELGVNPQTGAIIHLIDHASAQQWADASHPLAALTYEAFGQDDYERFWQQYIRDNDETRSWARPDYTKPGMTNAHHFAWQPRLTAAYRAENRVTLVLALPDASARFGAPRQLLLDYQLSADTVNVTLSWFDKPACRLPEAFWLAFQPITSESGSWHFEKLGSLIAPEQVVSRGARTLHAVDQRVIYRDGARRLEIATLDAPLVAPGRHSLLDFHDQVPDLSGGVHFNLYNNVWGTNFPMWFDENASFRFILRFSRERKAKTL